jgi:patatin-like phospholipase/acyl hydrolase
MGSYRILSIDGGGARGIISARMLQRLAKARPDLLDRIDLIAGTSAGAIIAACLAHGLTYDQIFDLYYHKSKEIFSRSWLRALGLRLFVAKYGNSGRDRALRQIFKDTTLGELKKSVLIATLDLDAFDAHGWRSYKPKFFHNLSGQDPQELATKVVDILLYSTAAPTLFPAHHGFTDGGIVANNPSVAAVAQSLDPKTEPLTRLEDIRVLSIGAGKVSSFIPNERMDWGFVNWATKLVDLMLNGSVDVADYECRQLLKGNYIRVNPYLKRNYEMDQIKCIDEMIDAADAYDISRHVEWIDTHL